MAQDIFLKINGIDGESPDSAHKSEIEVLSWS
jgi:type VI secretion system secreted protein Hcp